jgi:predicted nucleotide-binding protein (sugar kinase/HSP70/actin superfamily)
LKIFDKKGRKYFSNFLIFDELLANSSRKCIKKIKNPSTLLYAEDENFFSLMFQNLGSEVVLSSKNIYRVFGDNVSTLLVC